MPPLPWKLVDPAASGPVVVLGSKLELRRHRRVPGFMMRAIRVNRLARHSPGVVGSALLAEPGHKRFWTLSAWSGEEALSSFVASKGHRGVMARYRGAMADARFQTWTADASDIPPGWGDVRSRLTEGAAS